jgi:hypothetical protein
MKLISTLLLLLGSAVAQTQPFAFSEASAVTWQGKNVAPKQILAYVIEFEVPHTTILAHDYYFKPEGIAHREQLKHSTNTRRSRVMFTGCSLWMAPNGGTL